MFNNHKKYPDDWFRDAGQKRNTLDSAHIANENNTILDIVRHQERQNVGWTSNSKRYPLWVYFGSNLENNNSEISEAHGTNMCQMLDQSCNQ